MRSPLPSGVGVSLGRLALLAGGYLLTGVIGLAFPYPGQEAPLIWPAAGVAVAALYSWGVRHWPGAWAGALAVNLWAGAPLGLAAGLAAGSTAGPVAAVWLLRRVARFEPALVRKQDVFGLLGAGLGAMALSATNGAVWLCAGGRAGWGSFGEVWLVWWLGDATGVLVCAPPLLTWPGRGRRMRPWWGAEAAVVGALLVGVVAAVFDDRMLFAARQVSLAFLPFPVLIWAAFRLGPWGASWAALLLSAGAVWGTAGGYGPFAHPDVLTGLGALWAFLGTASAVSLLITALQAEGDRADAERERLFALSHDLMCIAGTDGSFKRVNPAFTRVLGHSAEELLGRPFYDFIHPEDVEATRAKIEALGRGAETAPFENRYRCKDGSWRHLAWAAPAARAGEGLLYAVGRDVTERKRAEQAEREAGQRWGLVMEQFPAVIWATDRDLRFTMSAGKGLEGLGLRTNQVVGLPLEEYLRTADEEFPPLRAHRRALAGQPEAFELEWAGRAFSCLVRPYWGADGAIRGVLGVALDVTEQKRAEAALRESEARYRAIVEATPECVKVVAPDGMLLQMNKAGLAMVEADESAVGRCVYNVIAPEHRERFRAFNERVCRGEEGSLQFDVIGLRGTRRHMETTAVPLASPEGQYTHLAVTRDITERVRAEEEVRASRWMLQTVMDNIPQGVFWKDRESRFLGCNRMVARLLGLSGPEEIAGRRDRDLAGVRPEEAEQYVRTDREVMASGEPIYGIIEPGTLPDGSRIWMETSKVPMRGPGGEVVGVLGTCQDITERKRAREALEWSNRMLDAMSRSQARFISEPSGAPVFEEMLATVLEMTGSEYGLIGEVLRGPGGRPYLKSRAITNLAWDDEARALYEQHARGGLEFHNLDNLFGAVLTTGEAVIANDAANDPRRGGLPGGHPPLRSFLGLPFRRGHDLIGVVGVANRAGGYDAGLVRSLGPFLHTCATLMVGLRNDRERRQAEEATREALAEKEALLKEIHHRVKNNLQVISSLLNLQAERLGDDGGRAVFVESQSRVRAMALVHETLYRSGTLARIDLAGYLEGLCDSLLRTYGGAGRVRVERRVAAASLDLDRALPCGLIVNELVSNALKYAFPGGRVGRVVVAIDPGPGAGYTLTVSDDGVGLPEGADLGGGRSLGLHLVNLLARQLRGRLEVGRSGGTTFTLSFPA